MMKKLLLTLSLVFLLCGRSGATTVTLQNGLNGYTGQKDCQTQSDDGNIHIEGYGLRIYANNYDVIYFDLSSIPASATINSATLSLYIDPSVYYTSGTIHYGYLLDPSSTGNVYTWEGSAFYDYNQHATFNKKKSEATSVLWQESGTTNITGVLSELGTLAISSSGWKDLDITDGVQEYVNGTTNMGFYVGGGTANIGSFEDYLNKWATGNYPKLVVDYTVGGGATRRRPIIIQ